MHRLMVQQTHTHSSGIRNITAETAGPNIVIEAAASSSAMLTVHILTASVIITTPLTAIGDPHLRDIQRGSSRGRGRSRRGGKRGVPGAWGRVRTLRLRVGGRRTQGRLG